LIRRDALFADAVVGYLGGGGVRCRAGDLFFRR
jgi:hypothetical protein